MIDIPIPRPIQVMRLYFNDIDKDIPVPDKNSHEWIDVNDKVPSYAEFCWVKIDGKDPMQAIYYILPVYRKAVWIDRYEDIFLEKPTHWMPLSKTFEE